MKMWISSPTLDRLVLVPDQCKQLHELVIVVAVPNQEDGISHPSACFPTRVIFLYSLRLEIVIHMSCPCCVQHLEQPRVSALTTVYWKEKRP